MAERKRITHQFMQAVGSDPLIRVIVPAMLLIGVFWTGWQVFVGDWLEAVLSALGVALLLTLAASERVQQRVLHQRFNRRHALYIALAWVYGVVWLIIARALISAPLFGKASEQTYFLLILLIAFSWAFVRSLLILLPMFYRRFVTAIPIWEQIMLAINEAIAAGLLATIGASTLVHIFQPNVFTTRFDVIYVGGIGLGVGLYYLTMQLMWTQRGNDWLSRSEVWIMLARLFAPLALIVTTLVIFRHFIARADPRSANLLGGADFDLTILALAPVFWLLILVAVIIVFTSKRGIQERFLPELLLKRLPRPIGHFLRSISDTDMLLIVGALATFIPAYLVLFGDTGGVIGQLRQQILQRGSALIETSEQALALLFSMPFYVLVVALLALYGYALSRQTLSADDRDELVSKLPVGFLIVLIITLYFFAIPFSQVLTEGRLPQLPQDLGRILLYNVLIPLVLLYGHYFVLIRQPYARGQNRWRERQTRHYDDHLKMIRRQIAEMNAEIAQIDLQWQDATDPADPARIEALYRYIQLNGRRDDLNMQQLQVVANQQKLADLSDAPVSIAVARLPVRIVSIGIPVLLAIQIYQWAILNNGLREIANNPNITIFEFFRAILRQAQF